MPGKCKFQDSWLDKHIYQDWLVKDAQDIHFARCRACCKSIKLQTMGEAALTSHAGGAGHKAAVRKLVEAGNVMMMINAAGQVNGSISLTEDTKEHVAICPQRDTLDRVTGSDWSHLHHGPTNNSTSHNAELQDVKFPSAHFTAPGTSRLISQRLQTSGSESEEDGHRSVKHDSVELSRLEHHQRARALERQQQQMKVLEKAFRMKKAYYKAKLKRMAKGLPPSSCSSSDEE